MTPARRGIQVHPPEFLTPPGRRVLRPSRIVNLDPPVQFRLLLPRLEMCPRNLQTWGHILHGGGCPVSSSNCGAAFGQTKPILPALVDPDADFLGSTGRHGPPRVTHAAS